MAQAAALENAFACEPQNFATASAIGECLRIQSLTAAGNDNATGRKALDWYATAIRLNAYDADSFLHMAMCLDWLGRPAEAVPVYRAAETRDPNNYYVVANIGWHYVQTGDYAAAQEWFTRSLFLYENGNDIAKNYLAICETRLAEKASGRPQLPSDY